MIRDRDRIYGAVVTRRLRAMCIRDKPTAPVSPWENGFAERALISGDAQGMSSSEFVSHGLSQMMANPPRVRVLEPVKNRAEIPKQSQVVTHIAWLRPWHHTGIRLCSPPVR
jgi:hypothetical protein